MKDLNYYRERNEDLEAACASLQDRAERAERERDEAKSQNPWVNHWQSAMKQAEDALERADKALRDTADALDWALLALRTYVKQPLANGTELHDEYADAVAAMVAARTALTPETPEGEE